jgi:hypothetical protein
MEIFEDRSMAGSSVFRDEKRRATADSAYRSSLCLPERRDIIGGD